MVHGDNRGLVLPPRIAPLQVVIVPVLYKDAANEAILSKGRELVRELQSVGIRAHLDDRLYNPGWKYNHWYGSETTWWCILRVLALFFILYLCYVSLIPLFADLFFLISSKGSCVVCPYASNWVLRTWRITRSSWSGETRRSRRRP